LEAGRAGPPCHFAFLDELAEQVTGFHGHYQQTAQPFQ
jgi:hypothetical protein